MSKVLGPHVRRRGSFKPEDASNPHGRSRGLPLPGSRYNPRRAPTPAGLLHAHRRQDDDRGHGRRRGFTTLVPGRVRRRQRRGGGASERRAPQWVSVRAVGLGKEASTTKMKPTIAAAAPTGRRLTRAALCLFVKNREGVVESVGLKRRRRRGRERRREPACNTPACGPPRRSGTSVLCRDDAKTEPRNNKRNLPRTFTDSEEPLGPRPLLFGTLRRRRFQRLYDCSQAFPAAH